MIAITSWIYLFYVGSVLANTVSALRFSYKVEIVVQSGVEFRRDAGEEDAGEPVASAMTSPGREALIHAGAMPRARPSFLLPLFALPLSFFVPAHTYSFFSLTSTYILH